MPSKEKKICSCLAMGPALAALSAAISITHYKIGEATTIGMYVRANFGYYP